MVLERPLLEKALEAVFSKMGLAIYRVPKKHAGGKWQLKYPSFLGGQGNLEVDLNFMFRLPIFELSKKRSQLVGGRQAKDVILMSYLEIAAGKLTALFARHVSRDLFDAYHILMDESLDFEKLRLIFCVYGAMSSKDWRTISLNQIAFDKWDLAQKLVPVLRVDLHKQWVDDTLSMVAQCREKLARLVPFSDREQHFFHALYEEGKVDVSLLTTDLSFIEKSQNQPLLRWRAQLVLQNQAVP